MVPKKGFEPLRAYAHHPLKMARLPGFATSAGVMAGVAGIEPATSGFGDRCSTN
jgi:hypothetical protein